jgi:hypothetical protein
MAKVKKVNKAKKVVKAAKTTKVAKTTSVMNTKVDNKLSVLLLVLAFLIFALAAIAMNDSSKSVSQTVSPIKVVATPTAKPVVKTVKTTVKK